MRNSASWLIFGKPGTGEVWFQPPKVFLSYFKSIYIMVFIIWIFQCLFSKNEIFLYIITVPDSNQLQEVEHWYDTLICHLVSNCSTDFIMTWWFPIPFPETEKQNPFSSSVCHIILGSFNLTSTSHLFFFFYGSDT